MRPPVSPRACSVLRPHFALADAANESSKDTSFLLRRPETLQRDKKVSFTAFNINVTPGLVYIYTKPSNVT